MSSPQVDQVATGLALVIQQYQNSPDFIAFLTAILDQLNVLEQAFQDTQAQMDVDVALGVNLDVLGEIVGVSRVLPHTGNPTLDAQGILTDGQYAFVIKAKIVKNQGNGTGESMMAGIEALFGATMTPIDDLGHMAINIGIGAILDSVQIQILDYLDILPRPAGVRINERIYFDPDAFFGFTDTPFAMAFGELTDSSIGGVFAEIF